LNDDHEIGDLLSLLDFFVLYLLLYSSFKYTQKLKQINKFKNIQNLKIKKKSKLI
jgi:hypothetical protein